MFTNFWNFFIGFCLRNTAIYIASIHQIYGIIFWTSTYTLKTKIIEFCIFILKKKKECTHKKKKKKKKIASCTKNIIICFCLKNISRWPYKWTKRLIEKFYGPYLIFKQIKFDIEALDKQKKTIFQKRLHKPIETT